jgi:hypothetical protein
MVHVLSEEHLSLSQDHQSEPQQQQQLYDYVRHAQSDSRLVAASDATTTTTTMQQRIIVCIFEIFVFVLFLSLLGTFNYSTRT